MISTIPRLDFVKLRSNGFPGFGGINSSFLIEQNYRYDQGAVVTQTITRDRGQVMFSTGFLFDVSMKDVDLFLP